MLSEILNEARVSRRMRFEKLGEYTSQLAEGMFIMSLRE